MRRLAPIILVAFLLFVSVASADMGPKPSASIVVSLEDQRVQDESFSAKLFTCNDHLLSYPGNNLISQLNFSVVDEERGCSWQPDPLAWGGDCSGSRCSFNYMVPQSFRLAVYLPSTDRVYFSEVVERESFSSSFRADLRAEGSMDLWETSPWYSKDWASAWWRFLFALALTLVLEAFVAFIFFLVAKISYRELLPVLAVNAVSLPLVWFVFPLLLRTELVIIVAELFVFVFEAVALRLWRKEVYSWGKAFLLSLLMNLASFFVGGLVYVFFSFFLI